MYGNVGSGLGGQEASSKLEMLFCPNKYHSFEPLMRVVLVFER